MHTWNWRTWQGKDYLTCDLIEHSHGFFTAQFAPAPPETLTAALVSGAEVLRVKQVHGAAVLSATEISQATRQRVSVGAEAAAMPPGVERPQADGGISDGFNQSLWVCSADCTLALIADSQTGQVAAVHAGWRGTAQKILPVAIAKLQAQGSELHNLKVLLGPAVAGEVYQVGKDVAAQVGRTVVAADDYPSDALLIAHLQSIERPPVLSDDSPDHARLDVRRINQMQLEQLGLSPEQIAIAPHCTFQEPETFFSYRRTRRKQVQWSGIVSR